MSYTPSEAAVEVLKIERARHSESVVDAIAIGACACGWILDLLRFNDHIASAMLVALMGATVTEPCANPHHVEDSTYRWLNDLDEFGAPCPDCPAPRSLVVRECEQAGRLRAASRRDAVDYADWIGGSADLFREVPPTEETR